MRKKKTFTKKTINRCYNPPPSNTAVATYNNQSAIGKKSKSFKPPPKEKKIVKLSQCTTLYSRLERITTSKKQKKLGDFGANKKISKNPEAIYNSWSSKHNSELGFFLWKHNFELFWFVPCLYQRTPGFVRAFPVARALVFRFRWVSVL